MLFFLTFISVAYPFLMYSFSFDKIFLVLLVFAWKKRGTTEHNIMSKVNHTKKNKLSCVKFTGFSSLGYTRKLKSSFLPLKQHIAFVTSETLFPMHKIDFGKKFWQVVLFLSLLSCELCSPPSLSSSLALDLISSTFFDLVVLFSFKLKNTITHFSTNSLNDQDLLNVVR